MSLFRSSFTTCSQLCLSCLLNLRQVLSGGNCICMMLFLRGSSTQISNLAIFSPRTACQPFQILLVLHILSNISTSILYFRSLCTRRFQNHIFVPDSCVILPVALGFDASPKTISGTFSYGRHATRWDLCANILLQPCGSQASHKYETQRSWHGIRMKVSGLQLTINMTCHFICATHVVKINLPTVSQ